MLKEAQKPEREQGRAPAISHREHLIHISIVSLDPLTQVIRRRPRLEDQFPQTSKEMKQQ